MALLYNREARMGWSSSYTSSDGMDVNMSGLDQQETPAPSSTGLNPPTAPVLSNLPSSTSAGYGGTTTTTAEAQSGTPPARSSSSSPGGYQTAYNNMPSTSSSPQQGDGNGHRSSYWGGMASGIMLAVIVVLFALLFLCLRRRRRRRRQEYLTRENKDSEEGGTATPTSTQHSVSSVTPLRPAVIAPYSLSQQQEPPIILSSIDPSRNNTYFTGLDTSDVMSVRSTGTRTTNMDEPPPPYRPRSIAIALSRDSSVRHPPQPNHGANHGLSAGQDDSRPPIRSPFADPADDSLSEISEPSQGAPRRIAEDEYSAVSDLSYQRDGPAGGSLGRR